MTSKYTTPFYKLYHWIAGLPPKIQWSNSYAVDESMKQELATELASGYYIILVGTNTHLSSFIVSFMSWVKTGKWAKYSHAFMNCDNISSPSDRNSFKFVEAMTTGVKYSTFDEVFACNKVCLLSPKFVTQEEWSKVIDSLLTQVGKPYDDLFDLVDSTHVSCVEVILAALKEADYPHKFANLEATIQEYQNLVPQMYRDCIDFTVAYEA